MSHTRKFSDSKTAGSLSHLRGGERAGGVEEEEDPRLQSSRVLHRLHQVLVVVGLGTSSQDRPPVEVTGGDPCTERFYVFFPADRFFTS